MGLRNKENENMADISLHRTFWPVGHGAFYTELFFNRENSRTFCAVYDCGGKDTKIIKENVDCLLHECPKVDLLFISHLHEDHINGLQHLLSEAKHIGRVVLPYLEETTLVESYVYNALSDATKRIDTDKFEMAFIYNIATRTNLPENITFVDVDYGEHPEHIDVERLGRRIASGTPIRVPNLSSSADYCDWIYIPVNAKFDIEKNEKLISKLEKKLSITIKEKEHIKWEVLREALKKATSKDISELKDIYKKVFNGNPNACSMPVYSGPRLLERCHYHYRCCSYCDSYGEKWYMRYKHAHSTYRRRDENNYFFPQRMLGCLYMGDFETQEKGKLEDLKKILGEYFFQVGMQQVPHHFALDNHHVELYTENRVCAFGNVDNHGDVSFTQSVYKDIHSQVPIFVITEDKQTKFSCHFDYND